MNATFAQTTSDLSGGTEAARKVERALEFMNSHLDRPLLISDLADAARTSPSHFFVLFKRKVGRSPIDHFIRLRMQRAAQILVGTPLSVKEVAAALGYEDPFYFSRVFKSIHGTPPSEYRMAMAGSDRVPPLENMSLDAA